MSETLTCDCAVRKSFGHTVTKLCPEHLEVALGQWVKEKIDRQMLDIANRDLIGGLIVD